MGCEVSRTIRDSRNVADWEITVRVTGDSWAWIISDATFRDVVALAEAIRGAVSSLTEEQSLRAAQRLQVHKFAPEVGYLFYAVQVTS